MTHFFQSRYVCQSFWKFIFEYNLYASAIANSSIQTGIKHKILAFQFTNTYNCCFLFHVYQLVRTCWRSRRQTIGCIIFSYIFNDECLIFQFDSTKNSFLLVCIRLILLMNILNLIENLPITVYFNFCPANKWSVVVAVARHGNRSRTFSKGRPL